MPALRRDALEAALGREANTGLIEETEPHQRGFGTASRFSLATSTVTPGPMTTAQELQLVSGLHSMVV